MRDASLNLVIVTRERQIYSYTFPYVIQAEKVGLNDDCDGLYLITTLEFCLWANFVANFNTLVPPTSYYVAPVFKQRSSSHTA